MKNEFSAVKINDNSNILIVFKSMMVGVLAGIVAVLYRLFLTKGENISFRIYENVRENLWLVIPLILLNISMALFISFLIKTNKLISGSGIPQMEGIIKGYFNDRKPWYNTLITKFFGGIISAFSGLSLGREGPSIQLGATVGEGVASKLSRNNHEKRILIASGASAGLSAAFNAPLAGVIFSLEEVFKYFSPLILVSTITASVFADFISKLVFGLDPVFNFEIIKSISYKYYVYIIIIGFLMGVSGAFYNKAIFFFKRLYKKTKIKKELHVLIPFLVVIPLGICFPYALGGGHIVLKELELNTGLLFLIAIFVVKFIFSMLSFGSGAPGGIFFPLLVIGGVQGAILAKIFINFGGLDSTLFGNIIVLAMAAYFASIVRAPITGIVLIMEMTGGFENMLPLTLVVIISYSIANYLKIQPIYESLLKDILGGKNEFETDGG